MALPVVKTPTDFPFTHTGQPDKLGQSLGGDFSDVQGKFDSRAIFNQTQINAIITALNSIADGDSGADNVKATAISGLMATSVQGLLEELKSLVDTQLPTPDGSVTNNKLATDVKVGSLALSTSTDKSSVITITNELDSKKLDKTEKAADSDKWDGWHLYNSVEELGLTALTCTYADVANALPVKGKLVCTAPNSTFSQTDIQYDYLKLIAEKHASGKTTLELKSIYGTSGIMREFHAHYNTDSWSGWKELAIVSPTTETVISSGFPTNWSGQVRYGKTQSSEVIVGVYFEKSIDFSIGTTTFYTLPLEANIRPKNTETVKISIRDSVDNEVIGSYGYARVNTDGTIQIYSTGTLTNARRSYAKFVYLV